jgi:hypothetical protein
VRATKELEATPTKELEAQPTTKKKEGAHPTMAK